ncbi:MAG: flagellar type III secretion system pore protein FliP [Treponema sp.]|jgi:flagellar biosynthetic protein FliP|nr:flagellar type III secretion system pore protein FliP [Treponema sp.]
MTKLFRRTNTGCNAPSPGALKKGIKPRLQFPAGTTIPRCLRRGWLIPGLLFILAAGVFAQDITPPPASTSGTTVPAPDPSRTGTTEMPAPGEGVIPFIDLTVRNPANGQEVSFSLRLLLLITVLSLAPSIIILMTSFLRISIVLDFVKRALSLQQVPPNQVLLGISLFLTLFIMFPTLNDIYQNSFRPLADGNISVETAYREAEGPLRLFMFRQMQGRPENIRLFMRMRGLDRPQNFADVPTYVLIPAFILSELTVAFKIGIMLFIPFIVIDMVVASALMSMGMIMLPPVMISMPFKLMLFILVDGWSLLTGQLVRSFILG